MYERYEKYDRICIDTGKAYCCAGLSRNPIHRREHFGLLLSTA